MLHHHNHIGECLPYDRFLVKRLLSEGSQGLVYLAYSHRLHQTLAVKVEKLSRSFTIHSAIQEEAKILKELQGIKGVPQILESDCGQSQFSYYAMPLLGKDLSYLLKKCEGTFSLSTVLKIAKEMVQILQNIHQKGFLHRDIKPENIVMGIGKDKTTVHLIDFGTAKAFKERLTQTAHLPIASCQQFVGTFRYAARAPHFGEEQSRKDDLESLGYVLVYLCKGRLPWQDLKIVSEKAAQQMIGKMKANIAVADLCEDLPSFFHWFMHYVKALEFNELPDYERILEKISSCEQDELKCFGDSHTFDWTMLSINHSHVCISHQEEQSTQASNVNRYKHSRAKSTIVMPVLGMANSLEDGNISRHVFGDDMDVDEGVMDSTGSIQKQLPYSFDQLIHQNNIMHLFQQNQLKAKRITGQKHGISSLVDTQARINYAFGSNSQINTTSVQDFEVENEDNSNNSDQSKIVERRKCPKRDTNDYITETSQKLADVQISLTNSSSSCGSGQTQNKKQQDKNNKNSNQSQAYSSQKQIISNPKLNGSALFA